MHIFPACLGYALLRVGAAGAIAESDACSLLQSLVRGSQSHAVAPWPPAAPKPVAVAAEIDDISHNYKNAWKSYLSNVADIYLALDGDKNKMVSILEFVKVFKEDVWADATVLGHFVDKDGDGQIDIGEFKKWLTQVPEASEEQRMPMLSNVVLERYLRNLAEVFFMLDIDMDKSLTLQELSTLFNAALWRQATIGVLLDLVDGNGDKGLDFVEFRKWFVGNGTVKDEETPSEAGASAPSVPPTPSEAATTPSESPVELSERAVPDADAGAAPSDEEEVVTLSEADLADITIFPVESPETAAPIADPSGAAEESWEEEADEWDRTMSKRAEAATQTDMTWEEEEQAWIDRIQKHKDQDITFKEPVDTETWDKEAAEWDEITKAQQKIDGNAEAAKAQGAEAQDHGEPELEEPQLEEPQPEEPEPEEPVLGIEAGQDSTGNESKGKRLRRRKGKKEGTNEGNLTNTGILDDQGAGAMTEEEEDAENCADKEPTGFKVNGWSVPCMGLARECENPIFSEALQIACPMTCGRCFQLKVEAAAKKSKEMAKAREQREAEKKQAAAVAEAKAIADSVANAEDAAVAGLKKKLEEEEATRAAEEERRSTECKDVDDEHTGFSTESGGPVGCKDLAKYCDEASFSVQIQSACPATCRLCEQEAKVAKTDKKRRK